MKQNTYFHRTLEVLLIVLFSLVTFGCNDEVNVDDMPSSTNTTVEEINANIKALHTLLVAKTNGKKIKSCTLTSNYTYDIEMQDGNSITIKTNVSTIGEEEKKVYYPEVSVIKDGDIYYWALDGEILVSGNNKMLVSDTDIPMLGVSDDNYWTITCGSEIQRLAAVEEGTVKSIFSDVILTDETTVKFLLRGELPSLTLERNSSTTEPIKPTGTLRRPIDKDHPAWLVHIDVWNKPDPQAIIDLIPEDVKPYVIFNIALSVSRDDNGNFIRPVDGYNTVKSWLRVCAENNVWTMVQASSGGYSHWPDFENYADFSNSLFEEFYQEFPNFVGFNYAEQGWGFSNDAAFITRLKHFANLLKLNHEYGGYLVVSFFNPSYGAALNGVGCIKRCSEFAEACKTYSENFIPCEKYTQTNSFLEMESTSLGVFLSGYADNYGIRFDECGWAEDNSDLRHWNDETEFQPAAGAIPVIEHIMLTGEAVMDGPELIWKQCFEEGSTTSAGDGYTKRTWKCFNQFENISLDIFRKILDGTIRIMSRKEVIDRTKIVVVNNISPTGATMFDPGYAAPATLYQGLYLMDEDGTQLENRYWFKKTGRYPAIPIVANLADNLAHTFQYQINASQFNSNAGWGDLTMKKRKFNSIFPEEYKGDNMFAGRYENGWVIYNCYATTKTASIPFKYNTCEKMELAFGKYSTTVVKEYSNSLDLYLTNYSSNRKAITDKIVIYGCSSQPSFTFTNRVSGNTCTVNSDWQNGIFTLTVKHNGALDLHISNCAGTATDRETNYTLANITKPTSPSLYNGTRQYEAEHFEYKNISKVYSNAALTSGTLKNFVGMGYIEFGESYNAAVRDFATVNEKGRYTLKIRYCAPTTTVKTVALIINGTEVAIPEFTATGSSNEQWQTVSIPVDLNKGQNKIELKATATATGTLYLDYITIEKL